MTVPPPPPSCPACSSRSAISLLLPHRCYGFPNGALHRSGTARAEVAVWAAAGYALMGSSLRYVWCRSGSHAATAVTTSGSNCVARASISVVSASSQENGLR
jgi:hypothetical protein